MNRRSLFKGLLSLAALPVAGLLASRAPGFNTDPVYLRSAPGSEAWFDLKELPIRSRGCWPQTRGAIEFTSDPDSGFYRA